VSSCYVANVGILVALVGVTETVLELPGGQGNPPSTAVVSSLTVRVPWDSFCPWHCRCTRIADKYITVYKSCDAFDAN